MLGGPISGAIGMPVNSAPRTGGGGAAYEPQSVEYAGAGSYTFTVPAGASAIDVVVIGGGGSGGAHTSGTSGGPSGNAGGTSSFGSFCSATGGSGGSGSQSPRSPILGGIGSGGDTNLRGGQGGTGDINRGQLSGPGGDGQGGAPGGGGSGSGGNPNRPGGAGGAGGDYGGAGGAGNSSSIDLGPGNPPGGGGGGQIWGTGGGGGGVAIKRVSVSPGDAIPVLVGAGGASVSGSGSYPFASGAGADGAVRLSWVGAPYAGPTALSVLDTATLRVPQAIDIPYTSRRKGRGALGEAMRFPNGITYLGTSGFTIAAVITSRRFGINESDGNRGVFGNTYGDWGVVFEPTKLQFWTYTTNSRSVSIRYDVSLNKKYGLIVSYDGQNKYAHVSGLPSRSAACALPRRVSGTDTWTFDLGAISSNYGVFDFDGIIHDFATWNKVLTDEEIAEVKDDIAELHSIVW